MSSATTRRALLAAGLAAAASPIRIARAEGAFVPPTTEGMSPTEKLQRVLRALELFGIERPDAKDLPGATNEELAEAERLLGFPLPATMRQFYGAHNGSQIWGFWPLQQLDQSELPSVVTGTEQYRQWRYPVPQELFLFGDSGSESAYGLWITEVDRGTEPVVVEMGDDEEPCLTIVGDDLASFLLGRMAIYFVIDPPYEYDAASVVEILGVPQELRHFERKVVDKTVDRLGNPIDIIYVDEEEAHRSLVRWANPSMPHPAIFGYEFLMTVDEINEFVASRNR
jgi:SMI1/KNR4 family protein SUKH-1